MKFSRISKPKWVFFVIVVSILLVGSVTIVRSLAQVPSRPDFVKSAIGTNGLQVQLSLNSSTMVSGDVLNATLIEYNTLSTLNNVSATSHWALASLPGGPCALSDPPPLALLIFYGYYASNNISSAIPLPLMPPNMSVSCPARDFNFFVFQPSSSSMTAVKAKASTNTGFSMASELIVPYPLRGYFSTTQTRTGANGTQLPALTIFPPGTYTIVVGDEWGNLILSYLEVV